MKLLNKGFTPFLRTRAGFTLAELMIAAGILAFVLAGLLVVFINCILLNELNRNLSLAYNAVQAEMEQIKDRGITSFDSLDSLNGTTFELSGFSANDAEGRIEVSGSGDLRQVRIVACFMSRNRLIGDDLNNCQASPVELVTLMAR